MIGNCIGSVAVKLTLLVVGAALMCALWPTLASDLLRSVAAWLAGKLASAILLLIVAASLAVRCGCFGCQYVGTHYSSLLHITGKSR